jgi:predicted MFS family arabinose efflux permease
MLGLVTIVAYGSWYYAFGVLLDPIRVDTGWRESSLAVSFSAGIVAAALASIPGGRLLDRRGSRLILIMGGIGGGAGLTMVATAPNYGLFLAGSILTMAALGGFGFYHVTMTAVVQLHPHNPTAAIAALTIWGAFSSFLYLPLTAALVRSLGWRTTGLVLAATAVAVFALAAWIVPDLRAEADDTDSPVPGLVTTAAALLDVGRRRRFTAAVALGGVAMSTILVYQVPAMTAAGLPLAAAATLAGARGLCQLLGRLPLGSLVARVGPTIALIMAFGAMAAGGALLAVASTVVVGASFAVLAGFGIGAFSPLQGIKAEQLYERRTLGATMGLYSSVLMAAGAAGPAVAGVLADLTGDRRTAAGVITVSAVGAALAAVKA